MTAFSIGELRFPFIFNGKPTAKGIKKGEELPKLEAARLRPFETVFVTFTLRFWKIGNGGFLALLQEVVAIDYSMAPGDLRRETDSSRPMEESSPAKKRRVVA